jgi:hypothetical protein
LVWGIKDDRYMPGKYVFASDYQEHAAMNIDGCDVMLKLVNSQELKSGFNVGDHSSVRYHGDTFDVEVIYTVTGVCKPDDEQCEVTDYNATITVTSGSAHRSLAAHGICGSQSSTFVKVPAG